jgi:hypothetical protein
LPLPGLIAEKFVADAALVDGQDSRGTNVHDETTIVCEF